MSAESVGDGPLEELSRRVLAADDGTDDRIGELEGGDTGVLSGGLLYERKEFPMPSGEGTDDEVLAGEQRECVGGPDAGPELQVGRRQGLGLVEPSGHHCVERVVESGDPPEPRLAH